MRIKWLGHSCFLLTNAAGNMLLTDPFDGSVGYPVPDVRVDVVTASHGHFDHHYVAALPKTFRLIDTVCETEASGFHVKGVPSWHDHENGKKRGANIIYVIESDGVRVAHMGDIGHPLDKAQLRELGGIDVLLIPVGGHFTIDSNEAADMAHKIGARITVPMHYKTSAIGFPIADEKAFLQKTNGEYLGSNEMDTTKCGPGVWAMDYE